MASTCEMGIGEVNSSHYMILINYPRAGNVVQWYQEAFGAEILHQKVDIAGVEYGLILLGIYYLRVGPVGCCAILEIRESIPDVIDDEIHDELKQKKSNSVHCLCSNNVELLVGRVMGAGAQAIAERVRGAKAIIVQETQHFYCEIIDPFGYSWFIGSMNHVPKTVFGLNQNSGNNQNHEVGQVDSAHLVLLIDYPRAQEAKDWYKLAFGAAPLYENGTQIYLQLGPNGNNSVIEIRGVDRPRVEQDDSNGFYSMNSDNADLLHQQAMSVQAFCQNTEQVEQKVIHQIRDPFGFSWFILSTNLVSPQVYV